MRILGCDPGKNTDPFGIVLIEANKDSILVKGCTQYKAVPYPVVEQKIANFYTTLKIDKIIVESNSMGEHVIDSLRRNHNLPVIGTFTGSHNMVQNTKIMDKIDMTMWMNRLIQNATEGKTPYMKFAPSDSDDMKELNRQWAVFGEYHKNKFEAPSGGHDDLVMAMMLACHFARNNVVANIGTLVVRNKKNTPELMKIYRPATTLPDGAIPIGDSRQSWYIPK